MTRTGDFGAMEAFMRAVELGGFSAAARELKLTPSAISKLVTRLERSLDVRLLNRTTRKLVPTAPVLQEFQCREEVAMMAVYPHDRHRLPRVQAMLDFLVERFSHSPWRGLCDLDGL